MGFLKQINRNSPKQQCGPNNPLRWSRTSWLHFCQRLIFHQRQEADHVLGSQSITGSSHVRGHRARCLTIARWKLPPPNRHALFLPNPAPCLPEAHPFRAKLAQNFITILLRLISSSEAPSVRRSQSHCCSKYGSWAIAALENLLEIQKRGPYSRPRVKTCILRRSWVIQAHFKLDLLMPRFGFLERSWVEAQGYSFSITYIRAKKALGVFVLQRCFGESKTWREGGTVQGHQIKT